MKAFRLGLIAWLGAASLVFEIGLVAQQASPVAMAPVPPQLLSAKTVFISNAGADSGLFPHPVHGRSGPGL